MFGNLLAHEGFRFLSGDHQSGGRLRALRRGGGARGRADRPAEDEARRARGHPARGARDAPRDARHGHAVHRKRRPRARRGGGGGRRARGAGRHVPRRGAREVSPAEGGGPLHAQSRPGARLLGPADRLHRRGSGVRDAHEGHPRPHARARDGGADDRRRARPGRRDRRHQRRDASPGARGGRAQLRGRARRVPVARSLFGHPQAPSSRTSASA